MTRELVALQSLISSPFHCIQRDRKTDERNSKCVIRYDDHSIDVRKYRPGSSPSSYSISRQCETQPEAIERITRRVPLAFAITTTMMAILSRCGQSRYDPCQTPSRHAASSGTELSGSYLGNSQESFNQRKLRVSPGSHDDPLRMPTLREIRRRYYCYPLP